MPLRKKLKDVDYVDQEEPGNTNKPPKETDPIAEESLNRFPTPDSNVSYVWEAESVLMKVNTLKFWLEKCHPHVSLDGKLIETYFSRTQRTIFGEVFLKKKQASGFDGENARKLRNL